MPLPSQAADTRILSFPPGLGTMGQSILAIDTASGMSNLLKCGQGLTPSKEVPIDWAIFCTSMAETSTPSPCAVHLLRGFVRLVHRLAGRLPRTNPDQEFPDAPVIGNLPAHVTAHLDRDGLQSNEARAFGVVPGEKVGRCTGCGRLFVIEALGLGGDLGLETESDGLGTAEGEAGGV